MKKILCLILFVQFSVLGQENPKIDSLTTLYENAATIEQKVSALEALYDHTVYTDPLKSLSYAHRSMQMSDSANRRELTMKSYRWLGANHMYLGNMDSSLYYHEKTKELAILLEDDFTQALALTDIGNHFGLIGQYKQSFETYEAAIQLFQSENKSMNVGVTIGQLGSIHMKKGNYKIAQLKFSQALEVLDTLETEPYMEADILKKMGHIQYNLKNFKTSIDYFEKALQVYLATDDNVFAAEAYVDIGASQLEMELAEIAIENFKKSIALCEQFKIEGTGAVAYTNLGGAYIKTKQYKLANRYLRKSLRYHGENGFVNNKIQVIQNMAEMYLGQNELKKSLEFNTEALKIADSVKSLEYQMDLYLLRSKIYERLSQRGVALESRKKYEFFKDSLYNLNKTRQIEELKTIYETEQKETEIALQEEEIKTLNEKVKVDKLKKGLYAGGAFSGISLSALLFYGFRQRIKKNKIAREKQEAIYRQEIAYKRKELTSQTLHLVQKNTFIQELMDNLEKIKQSPDKFKTEFRRIVMLLKKENASDKDWEVFKTYFAEVHNDFDQKLRTLYSDISEKEIRLAAFLRMNLTTKEIAATLNVLPDSIKKSKYRLKKKLGLGKEQDLNSFLNTL